MARPDSGTPPPPAPPAPNTPPTSNEKPTTPPPAGKMWVWVQTNRAGDGRWELQDDPSYVAPPPAPPVPYPGYVPGMPTAPPRAGYHYEAPPARNGIGQGWLLVPNGTTRDFAAEQAWELARRAYEGYSYQDATGRHTVPGTGPPGTRYNVPPPAGMPGGERYRNPVPAPQPQPPGSTLNTRTGNLTLASGEVISGWGAARPFSFTPVNTARPAPATEPPYTGNVPLPRAGRPSWATTRKWKPGKTKGSTSV